MNDLAIIERAKQGDEAAFAELYRKYRQRVYFACLKFTRNPEDAEDLTQDAFLQCHRKLSQFRGDAQFSTWVHRIAINACLMALRKRRVDTVPLEQEMGEDGDVFQDRFLEVRDLDLEGAVDRITISHAVKNLPPGYRMIFRLHVIEGYEHHEIAERLGCSIGNSKSQNRRANLKLQKTLRRRQPASQKAWEAK